MKILSILLMNNPILGNLTLDFTDKSIAVNNIIFAGENGTGKSTILEILYDFSLYKPLKRNSDEKWKFTVSLNDHELTHINSDKDTNTYLENGVKDNILFISYDFGQLRWQQIKISFINNQNKQIEIPGVYFSKLEEVLRCIYSDVEINYMPNTINTVTSKILDDNNKASIKSTNNLATEVAQLLVDIQALDATDLLAWVRAHEGEVPPNEVIDIRMKRFTNAFSFMFENKRYKGVDTRNESKKVIFEEYGKEIVLDDFSSGEKQIIFRGSFLLKDQNDNKGIFVLIDEPEISLHPTWQLKIIDYYKKLFTDENGVQEAQIFFVTHSPFIIQNDNRINDKVIVLKRMPTGEIYIPEISQFYNWTKEEVVKSAFNLDATKLMIDNNLSNLIVTEGKTDWKHLKVAYENLRLQGEFTNLNINFLEYEDEVRMGDKELLSLCTQLSKIKNNKAVICIFDHDVTEIINKVTDTNCSYKNWGNNVFSFVLPSLDFRGEEAPISIEHYYFDEDLLKETPDGKRLYLGNEFSRLSGIFTDVQDRFCVKKDKCGLESISIIDSDSRVYMNNNENSNIALSKNSFAENILNGNNPFESMNFSNFKLIFDIVEKILNFKEE